MKPTPSGRPNGTSSVWEPPRQQATRKIFLHPANEYAALIRFIIRGGVPINDACGTREWVEQAVLAHADTIYRVAYHCLGNRADAEDIVHDVLLRRMEKAPLFQDAQHEKAWLIRVTINLCRDLSRTAWRRKVVSMEQCPDLPDSPKSSLLDEVAALPRDYRTVIYLHYYEGYSVREIAGILQKNERAVQSRLYRARQALKRRLEGMDYEYA